VYLKLFRNFLIFIYILIIYVTLFSYLIFYRSINQIKTLLTDLQDKIREIENQFGCMDELRLQLAEKQEKYGVHIEFSSQLKKSFEVSKLPI